MFYKSLHIVQQIGTMFFRWAKPTGDGSGFENRRVLIAPLGFDSLAHRQCPYRLSVRSTAFHAVESGSIPDRDTKFVLKYASLTQLVRVSVLHAECQQFESVKTHQFMHL